MQATQAVELDTEIEADGTVHLPDEYRELYGRKVRVVVLVTEQPVQSVDNSAALMELAGKIDAFKDIEDPVAFQHQLRDEWTQEWDK